MAYLHAQNLVESWPHRPDLFNYWYLDEGANHFSLGKGAHPCIDSNFSGLTPLPTNQLEAWETIQTFTTNVHLYIRDRALKGSLLRLNFRMLAACDYLTYSGPPQLFKWPQTFKAALYYSKLRFRMPASVQPTPPNTLVYTNPSSTAVNGKAVPLYKVMKMYEGEKEEWSSMPLNLLLIAD